MFANSPITKPFNIKQQSKMKANELRINNYVNEVWWNTSTGTYEKTLVIVTSINESHIRCQDDNAYNFEDIEPIPLTEQWLLDFGFENWGKGKQWSNEYETYDRFVLHNVLDGTSNFEVHSVISTYGETNHHQYIISCDEDDRINWGEEINHVHQLQNLFFALTGEELTIKK